MGSTAASRNDSDGAIAALQTALQAAPQFSDLARVYLGQVLTETGDRAGAAEIVHTPSLFHSFSGGRLIRLDSDYNAIMHLVAAETGTPIVDGYEAVEEHPGDFVDYCHFGPDGHRRLGEVLAKHIAEMLHH